MNRNYLILIIAAFMGSCVNSPKGPRHGGTLLEMTVNKANVRTIKIPDIPMDISTNVETIFDSVSFVRLSNDPEATLGGINQIIIKDSLLIIRDCYSTKSVKLFTLSGRYIRNVGNHGRGPGEYSEPTYMEVTPEGYIVIWDQFLKKLSYYDLSGVFLHSTDIPFFCMKFHLLGNDRYLFYSVNSDNEGNDDIVDYPLFECDSTMKPVCGGLYRKKDTYWSMVYDHNLFEKDNVVYYNPVYCDTVYAVYPERRIEAEFAFDFGKNAVPERLRDGRNRKELRREEALENYAFMGGNFFLTETHLFFGYTKAHHQFDCVYNLQTEELISFGIRSGFFPLYYGNIVGATEKAVVGYFFPAMIMPNLSGWDQIPYEDLVKQFGKERADLGLSMRNDDNPIITFFYAK